MRLTNRLAAGLLAGVLATGGAMAEEATDPFLFMEEVKGEKALEWVKGQNAKSEAELTADPNYAPFLDSAMTILTAQDRIPYVSHRGGFLYNFWQDDVHVLGLWRRTTPASYKTEKPDWEVLIDFDALAEKEGVKWVFKGADCLEPEGTMCLVSISPDGGDAVEVREFDVTAKAFVEGGFKLKTAKSQLAWLDKDRVLVGTDFGEGSQTTSGYPRITKLWTRGTPIEDAKTIFEGKTEDTGVWAFASARPEGTYAGISRAVDFFNSEIHAVKDDGSTVLVPIPLFAETQGMLKGQMLFSLREDWPAPDGKTYKQGSLLSFDYDTWLKTGAQPSFLVLFEPTERTAIEGVAASAAYAYVNVLDNVRGRVYRYAFENGAWTSEQVKLPENGAVAIADADAFSSWVMFNYEDFLTPDSLYWSQDDAKSLEIVKSMPARFDAAGKTITQYEATSKDGTKIPYFVVAPEGQAAPLPALLYAYGGFQVSTTPWYAQIAGKLWIERGNVFVVANIRGGGEFGPRWHEAGLKQNRQRVYDDFIAVAEDLVAKKITTPKQLGIQGGSNGGLLVGVAMTQRPDLFNAVLCQVPLLDMIRYTALPPGASWIAEYGDPAIPEEREAILKYSPYQNLKKDGTYPRAFFLTSTADDRVHPGHARKMAALMESYGMPFVYYEEMEGGHGAATNQKVRAKQNALMFTYLTRQLEGGTGQ